MSLEYHPPTFLIQVLLVWILVIYPWHGGGFAVMHYLNDVWSWTSGVVINEINVIFSFRGSYFLLQQPPCPILVSTSASYQVSKYWYWGYLYLASQSWMIIPRFFTNEDSPLINWIYFIPVWRMMRMMISPALLSFNINIDSEWL